MIRAPESTAPVPGPWAVQDPPKKHGPSPEPVRRTAGGLSPNDRDRPPAVHASAFSASSSLSFAALSIAASDLRTWLRSVVYQKSGSDAFR